MQSQMQTLQTMISQGTVSGKGTPADQPKLGRWVAGKLTMTWLSLCIEMHMPMQHGML